jgi:hypothetical protein
MDMSTTSTTSAIAVTVPTVMVTSSLWISIIRFDEVVQLEQLHLVLFEAIWYHQPSCPK